MKIERILQLCSGSYPDLNHGFSIQSKDSPKTKYFDPTIKNSRVSEGWGKDNWLSICSDFKLEFIYGEN